MTEFDAELHVRLVGERMLLGGVQHQHHPWGSPLVSAAQALVAIDAVTESAADQVLADYDLALALRSGQLGPAQHAMMMRGGARLAGGGSVVARVLDPGRVVPCYRDVQHPSGTISVRYVSLREDATNVAVTFRAGVQPSRARGASRAFAGPMMGVGAMGVGFGGFGPPQVTVADDRGTTANAHFAGGGSDEEWRGQLQADQPLAPDTAWIEIDGQRLALVGRVQPVDVAVEPLPEENPALRHLWQLATPTSFHGRPDDPIGPTVDALVAAGALSPEDPAIAEIRAVLDATAHGGMGPGGRGRRLPEPWRSMLARQGRGGGPAGALVIGAATPTFDGISVVAMALESTETGWQVEVEVAPDALEHGPFNDGGARRRQLAWWARDDRGNHYLGQMGSWSADDERGYGEIAFWPALDSRARRLDLMPTAETQRAVIGVPLRWLDVEGPER